jgi:hypothetical protein
MPVFVHVHVDRNQGPTMSPKRTAGTGCEAVPLFLLHGDRRNPSYCFAEGLVGQAGWLTTNFFGMVGFVAIPSAVRGLPLAQRCGTKTNLAPGLCRRIACYILALSSCKTDILPGI